jgi:hypothetical protein
MHGRCGSDPNLIQQPFEAQRPFELLKKEVRAYRPFIVACHSSSTMIQCVQKVGSDGKTNACRDRIKQFKGGLKPDLCCSVEVTQTANGWTTIGRIWIDDACCARLLVVVQTSLLST